MTRADRLAKGIYWDRSLNCFTGCSPVGAGCDNCWAKRTAEGRLRGRCGYPADEPFRPTFHPERLSQVNSKQKPQVIALCFMSDPFHEGHRIEDKVSMLHTIVDCSQHTFIALTKRYEQMKDFLYNYTNLWLEGKPIPNLIGGLSVWDQESADRMTPILLQTNLATRIVSLEPLLEGILLWGLDEIDGLIIGCESSPRRRPCELAWIYDIVDQAKEIGTPVFIKQLDINGKVSHNPEEWPADLRIRELPEVMS
ncbi:MAG: DUF5131 family protein [Candidatus Brocadiales bacterium]|nr:DUF5131 family protein [Candidatus Bathyanammoxibius sp.]